MEEKLKNLFDDYKKVRSCDLSLNQFASVVLTFPGIQVAMADGEFDDIEKENIKEVSKSLSNDNKELTSKLYSELEYLANNTSKWKEPFNKMLKNYLEQNSGSKETTKQLIYSVAEASEGISEIEQKEINYLSNYLNL